MTTADLDRRGPALVHGDLVWVAQEVAVDAAQVWSGIDPDRIGLRAGAGRARLDGQRLPRRP